MEKDLSLETNERFVNVFQWTDFYMIGTSVMKALTQSILKILNVIFIKFQQIANLTHIQPMLHFHTPWKHQKTSNFLMFSGGTETEQWFKMG